MDKGANIYAQDNSGKTPLHLATGQEVTPPTMLQKT
ncbi:MAG: hypothetical protein ACEY3L_14835 [Wolbachia sp.]